MSWSLGFVSLLVAQLRDVSHPATAGILLIFLIRVDSSFITTDLSDCGISVLHSLYHATQTLLDGCPSCQLLDDLIDLAYTSMTSRLDNTCWRRLYTDASLFRTLAVFAEDSSPIEKDILESIAQLDRAIIVAGAAGEGRLDLIWSIIKKIQSQYLPSQNHPKLSLSSSLSSTRLRLETASKLVPQLDVPPSLLAFQTSLRQNPFILRGFACDWPALQERSWQSLEYLRSVTGPGRIVPVEVGKDYRADDWTQRLMSWDDFLTYINSPKGEILYLAQHNIFMQFPSLKMDIIVPDYVYASLDDSLQFPGYRPPCNDEQLVTNVWLGPKGTMSPAHTVNVFDLLHV
jgi:hypothetical protein